MKVRLRVISADIHDRLKDRGMSGREYEKMQSWNIPSETSVVGMRLNIRGTEYFVLDQYPARKAANAAKKKMKQLEYRKWVSGL